VQPYILGVDIGTGSVKAVAVDLNGEAFDSSQVHYPMLPVESGFAEQELELIWQGFLNCIREIIGRLGQPKAISLSSAMHSLILVDAEGKPLTSVINWADTRSAAIADALRSSPEGKKLYEQNGTPIYSMSPLTKIIWFRQNRNDLFLKTTKFVSIKELIWYRLFSRFQIDHSIASATGLFDILKFSWSEEALKLAGIAADQLSEPVSTSYMREDLNPEIAKILGIKEVLPWMIVLMMAVWQIWAAAQINRIRQL
jgi:gluconokinase